MEVMYYMKLSLVLYISELEESSFKTQAYSSAALCYRWILNTFLF